MSTTRTSPAITRLKGVTYDMYVRVRDDPGNDGLRMAYHDGVLEIMSPEFRHEKGGRRLSYVVIAYCEAFDVAYEEAGSTTFRKGMPGELKGDGKEPDVSFYLGDAADEIVDKELLDLTIDSPPSLWIEVDNWGSSATKLPLYAGLEIPEVWRYRARARKLWFGRLVGDIYEEVTESVALPGLTPAIVLDLLDQGRGQAASRWVRWLKGTWFPEHRAELR
jgi:Uma2 family endonuclease